jgi:hypothetical protein
LVLLLLTTILWMTPAGGMTLSSNKDEGPLLSTLNDSSFFCSKAGRSVTSNREIFAVSSSGFLAGGGKKIVDFFSVAGTDGD